MPALIIPPKHYTGDSRQVNNSRRNKRHPHYKRRSKTTAICKWYDLVLKKINKLRNPQKNL